MQVLLIGKNGQIGRALAPLLPPLGNVVLLGRNELDVSNSSALRRTLRKYRPDLVINTSAYTRVDQAEVERESAWKLNSEAPGIMMQELSRWEGTLVHFSTDYVFDGMKQSPYVEEDAPNPLNEYGRSKLSGERLIRACGDRYLILRTSWVYAEMSQNFVTSIVRWAATQETLRVVDDQVGSPSWAGMLAELTFELLSSGEILETIHKNAGVYHFAGKGAVSRYVLAKAILRLIPSNINVKVRQVIPAKSSEFPSPAVRPGNSALDCSRFEGTFDLSLPAWDSSLRRSMQGLAI